MNQPSRVALLLGLMIPLVLLLSAGNLWFGNLNQDEGWYSYAALQTAQGHLPYSDFAYTQAPVLPFVYALFTPWTQEYGLAGSRALTALLGLLSVLMFASLAAWCAPVHRRGWAFLGVWVLLGFNSYQSYFTTILKTYSLTLFFLSAGFLFLRAALQREKAWGSALAAGLLAALAAGTRLSAVAVPVAVVLVLLIRARTVRSPVFLGYVAGAGVGLFLVFIPLFLLAPENAWFAWVGYHGARNVDSLTALFTFKLGFLARLAQAYAVWLMLLGLLLISMIWKRPSAELPCPENRWMESILWLGAAGMTLIHFATAFPYDDYQVPVYGMLSVALLLPILRRIPAAEDLQSAPTAFALALILCCGVQVAGSPIHQDWMIRGRELIWWRAKEQPDLKGLREAAAWLRDQDAQGPLLTQDLYLAVEAGMDVPQGLEMGPFSLFPSWSDEGAQARRVLNGDLLETLIRSGVCEYAAMSGYGFSVASPDIEPVDPDVRSRLNKALRDTYEPVHSFPYFGQAHTTLTIYRKRTVGEPGL